jgi:hypothetical protein
VPARASGKTENRVRDGMPVIRPELGNLEASPATVLDECVDDE